MAYFQAYDYAKLEGRSPGGENYWTEAVMKHTSCQKWADSGQYTLSEVLALQDNVRTLITRAQEELDFDFEWTSFICRNFVRVMVPDDEALFWLQLVVGEYLG